MSASVPFFHYHIPDTGGFVMRYGLSMIVVAENGGTFYALRFDIFQPTSLQ